MRFYSQKGREKNIIFLFKALKSKACSFSSIKIKLHTYAKRCTCKSEFLKSSFNTTRSTYFVSFLLILLLLTITSTAESNISVTRKLDTVLVIPGNTESTLWHNPHASLVHDVDENGVYQSFTKNNSAYFDGTLPEEIGNETINTIHTNTEVNTVVPVSDDVTNEVLTPENNTSNENVIETSSVPSDVSDTQTQTESDTLDTEASSDSPQTDSVPESTPEASISPEVSLFEMSTGFYLFSNVTRVLLPLANESLTTPIVSESEISEMPEAISLPNAENENPIKSVSEPVNENTETLSTDTILENSDTNGQQVSEENKDIAEQKITTSNSETGIVFSDFSLPQLNSGQFIRNVQLRMSLGALRTIAIDEIAPSIEVEYAVGNEWINAGTILLDSEVSNALNGGYFLFALPHFSKVTELENLQVRVSYVGATVGLERVFIDSMWLQIDTETFDRNVLKERVLPQELSGLTLPTIYEFISTDLDFTREELPKFSLKYESQRNGIIQFIRSLFGKQLAEIEMVQFRNASGAPIALNPQIDVTSDGLITIQLTESDTETLQPGTYAIELVVDEGGKSFTDSFTFQWGVLAVNTDKTQYTLGETTQVMLGAVSESGNTLCDAELLVYIIDPLEYISEAVVTSSGQCNGNNFIDVPDFSTTVTPTVTGVYEVYVERIGPDGEVIAHTSDTFNVVDAQPFALSRRGPTRINPEYAYPMLLTLSAQENFTGDIIEYVPLNFTILATDAEVREVNGMHELRWSVDMQKDESISVEYTFDAPDISPFLYTLGPAKVVDEKNLVVVREMFDDEMQSLVNETVIETNAPNETSVPETITETSVPTENISETNTVSNDAVVEPVTIDETTVQDVVEDVSQNTTTLQSDTSSDETNTEQETVQVDTQQQATSSETVVEKSTPIQAEEGFTEHRRWQIASDATGSMIVFWTSGASIPANWTCISCTSTSTFYQRFPKGGATYGTNGGTATTTHTANGSVNASTVANAENNAGSFVSIVSHSHTYTPTIASTTTLPAYRQLRVIQSNNAGDPGTIPAGAILIFDGTLPAGWSQYAPLDNRYPRGENTIVSAGTNTHTHSVTGTTSAASGSTYNSRTGGTQVTAASLTHTHSVSSSTPAVSQEPPFIEVIFATSSVATTTPVNAIALWSDTPPAGWLDRSSTSEKPFYNKYIKGASTYGTVGGAETHTHADMAITSSQAVGTDNARTGSAGAGSTHTHVTDVTSFSTASNTPPYVTAIIAKFYGYIPIYDQTAFRWYVNNNATLPTDPWPVGAVDLLENEPIDVSQIPVSNGEVIRLRMGLTVSNSTTTGESFKLQFGTTTALCTAVSTWSNVGQLASSTAWIGYNNATPVDGATLSSSVLSATDVLESYEELNPTVTLPNVLGIGQDGEWDFVLQQNNAEAGTNYCFRMVESDGTELFAYTMYPMLVTNSAPSSPTLSKLFDNEKVASTTPEFEFTTSDAESNEVSYQIQIDDDRTFGSVNIDQNSVSNGDQFINLATPADKDPFTNGETIRFTPPSALSNGVTYYWRVRGQDPNGSNAWGTWSTIYSFTIDTSVTVSTWFQTTEEQFDTDTLSGTDALVTDVVQLATGSTTGTTTSSAIDFSDGNLGNAWGSLAWTDTETSSDLKYRIQYYEVSTSNWLFIPDSALSGNGIGFDTSPISLLGLDTDTYTSIRIVAVFTNAGASPVLSDWTVSWGYRIDTPTNNAPFPNEKISTTTPTFEFYTNDPQNDDLVYEIQWSTTYAFTASTTKISGIDAGFVNSEVGGDTSPFNSGDVIQFTVRSADALINGTTYWWRVRAIDPTGSNQYSFYTEPQSVTVDTTVTVSTWFQTTSEQFDTDILSGTVSQSGNTATVATTTKESLIAYAEGTVSTPRYRIWDGTVWGTESDALDVGAPILWTTTRSAPSESEYILATIGTDADVNVQVFRNGSWGNLQEVTIAIPNTAMRGFDVVYEQVSGDALVVTCDGDADPTYYVWNGTSWTNGGAVGLTNTNTCGWVKLIADPVSDEIIVVTRDTSGVSYEARVWSGSAWGNSATWGSMNQVNHEGIAAEYEESGNQAVVAVSNGTASSFSWRAWNGSAWSAATAVTLGDDFEAGTIVADDGSDNMALCYIDQDNDIGAVRWNGSAWVGQTELETAWAATAFEDRPIDCVFEVGGVRDGYIMAVYSDTTNLRYRYWDGATWIAEASISTIQDSPRVQVRRTTDNLIQTIAYDNTNDRYDYSYWNGTAWSAFQTLETNGSAGASPYKEPFMIATNNPGTTGTVVGNPAINFYDGSGPYWQQMSWVDTTSGGSDILYQVEYYNGTSWQLVPDSLISGNSAGITTSPINLTSVLPASTYSMIRPVANMTCNLGTCPVLSDWTITWSAGITISGTAQQFNQSTNVTSGTVSVAVNGVLQIGKTGTISGGTWSIANVNTAQGDIVTVFVNGANDTNEATAVARYDGVGDMSGLRLYEQHLTLGSNDATSTPFTNANIGLYDFTNDEDLFYDVASTSLTMCADATCGDSELYIMASSTYKPTGTTNLNNIENNGTINFEGNTLYVARSWDNNGTTTLATSNVIFTATSTTESIDETGAITPSFYNLTFGTTTGSATWNLATPLDVNNTVTVTRGTLARGTVAITVGGSLVNSANGTWTGIGTTTFDGTGTSNWSDSNAVLQNVGRVVIDGTSKTIQLGGNVRAQSVSIGSDDVLDVSISNYDIYLYSDFINNNAFVARSGEVFFNATTTNRTITAGGDAFYDVTFNGAGGSWSFTEPNLSITNNLTIATGTVTMPTGTTTLSGSFSSVGGTFAHNNATVLFNASSAKTISASGTPFTNAFYNMTFMGSGSWSFLDTSATTSNHMLITQGTVIFPSANLSVGGSFTQSGGSFTHNSGTVTFTSASAETIDVNNTSFNSLAFMGGGSWSFVDASVTALGSVWVNGGTVIFPSSTFTIGGSLGNTASITHNSGTVLFSSTDGGETINLGNSSLYNMTFNGVGGGWTITAHATTTNNFTLSTTSAFTLANGQTLAVGGVFSNAVANASTTWTGSTLSLEAGNYSINTKTNTGDAYATLRVKANTDIKMWNSSAGTYTVDGTGSLYSQDHAGVDGDLYIFGNYPRTSGNEYWSYATDFDGTVLGTSSSRQVDVRFASGASASITGSLFEIQGSATATTTIANQGSGTYTIASAVSTTTFRYYDFNNLGISGVTLAGTGVVTSLADGSYEPSVGGGTGLTVASSTIDANPGLQIYRVDFSTTTLISATNVTQYGGAPTSYWWFRESLGNIDGEAFDNDTGDPGSIRWDDSSLSLTIEGKVYADDGVTPLGSPTCDDTTQNIRIVVQGGGTHTGSCASADGTFSIPGVVVVGSPVIAVYLDTNGGVRGTVITKTPTANILDLDIYANRVTTRHEDVDALTIADMAIYDSGYDTDIRYDAATGTQNTLTVFAGNELHIASSTTFAPGGDITIHAQASSSSQDGSLHIDNYATFIGSATSTYTVGGSFSMDVGATFTSASTTVLMNATTTGKTITTTASQEITFNTLTFNGSGGGWNINGDIRALQDIYVTTGTVTGTSDVTVVNGSLSGAGVLSFGSGTTTIERTNTLGSTTPWTFGNLVLGSGAVTGTTTPGGATTTILGKLTIGTGHYLNGGNTVWNLAGSGNVFVENGTFIESNTTVRYSGVGATNVLSTSYYNLELMAQGNAPTYTATGLGIIVSNNLTVGGATTTTFTLDTSDPALDVNGNVAIDTTGIFIGSGSATTTIGGNWTNNGIFTGSNGRIIFDGNGTSNISAGNSAFSNLTINGSASFTITEHATTTGAFTLTNAGAFTVNSGQVLAVGGVFTNSVGGGATTWTGSTLSLYSGTNYSINAKTISDDYSTLVVGTNTDIRMWNSTASTYAVDGTGSLYSQDHAGVDGDLYVYGNYPGNGGTDYWNYATDFDGTTLGGSERKVDVFFASGASAVLTTGGLAVVGSGAASTTIQNQGSGTYGLRIGGTASTTWSYYELRDMDSSGLTFSGTPNVVTLSYGDIKVSQNNGTGMTVGGTVITQNPAKTFIGNIFATSTAISAFNVTATGTANSSWRFTIHSGNIAGEAFDVDPDGDPGYVAWDNSAGSISISGNVYSDEGSSVSTVCDSSSPRIRLIVGGIATTTVTSCNGNGAGGGTGFYQFTGIQYSVGDPIIVYIDGVAQQAATVTEDPISNINNMDLYENRVIVRHEGIDPLSIADMALWDSSDDADIPFTAVDAGTDTLTLPANRKLIVWTNKEFRPNGNVTLSGGGAGAAYDGTLELYTNAIFNATGGESHAIGGSFISGNGATFDDETSTVTFTTTGATRTVDTNQSPFYNLVFNGSGSWTVTDASLSIGNDFTITQGAVTLPSGTTTVTGSLSVTSGSFNANGGTMLFNSSASETIRAGSSNFGALTINGSGSFTMLGTNATVTADVLIQDGTFTSATGTLTIGGDFVNNDTFTHGSGVLRFTGTTTTNVTAFGSDLFSTTFAGGGTYTFTDTNVALLGTLSIQSGSVTLATGTMSVAGSFLNTGGSFNHSSGTILFNSSDTGETVNPGASPFHVVSFASAGGGWTISGNATTTSNFSLTSATNFTLASSTRLTVGGVFTNLVGGANTTWTGSTLVINSGSGYTINTKVAGGDVYNTLIVGSSTALRAWDSSGIISMGDAQSSLYSQDHAGVSGTLYIYGEYLRTTGTDYWSYATDFDGTALGGSSRQAFVYMGSNASTTVRGGTLNIVGANGFDTTISNQGSGTYAIDILGGTFNAQYYSFANMNVDGLTLSGTTTITSLTEGNFTLAVNGGSLITLSSTTLNYNTGLIISNTSFATTSAITGFNVALLGTTPSSWTFTGHSGNFDGEAFDSDGIDDCGSIRWSDSVCLLTTQSGYRFRNDDGGEGVPNSEWYDQNWSKRKRVTVANPDAVSYTNAVVKLTVTYDSDMQTDFEDVRFTDSSGTTLLSHFTESYTASTNAVVWVKVPTLATSTNTQIYMYYGNGGVSDASATSTFSVIDTYEDGNISEYTGDTAEFIVDGADAYERTYRLEASDPDNGKTDFGGMYNNSVTVNQGKKLRVLKYINTSTGSGDEVCTLFGTQNQTQNYAVCLELFGIDRLSLAKNVLHRDTSGTVLSSTTVTYSTGWYEVEVQWNTNNLIFVTLSKDGSVVATTSATDSTYTTGGIGYTLWGYHGGWDVYSARPLLQTEPTITFGFEQVSGGASWLTALNTPGTGIGAGDKTRVRFLVENTGLPITNQNYEIEFASKGASPSCEAVAYSSYVEVPNVASCGTSALCMESSTQFTNLASTTDVLGGTGTFTQGQIIEDPSNNTTNISVASDAYTELEYVITPTLNASDSVYCLRVSNEGTDLDSYTHVAELGLFFAPNITALSLNGGFDITLTGGATTTVTATGTVTDQNGYTDLAGATSTIFRSGVGESCSLNNNNCYISGNSLCSFVNCSGNSCDVECTADIYYHADPTDIGTFGGETWRALLAVSDFGGSIATATAPSIDLLTLQAISVDSSINYGSLAVNADTGSYNATTTVANIGNGALDILLEGTDLTDGGSSAIPVNTQHFATSTFTYSACVYCTSLSTTTTNYKLDLAKPASTTPAVTDQIFWGISVPFGVAGTPHQGTNIFYATADTP